MAPGRRAGRAIFSAAAGQGRVKRRPAPKLQASAGRTSGTGTYMRAIWLTKILGVVFLTVISSASLQAGRQEGVMTEFRKVEEDIRHRSRSQEQRQKTLEDNLLRAVRITIMRQFYEKREELLRDLNIGNVFFENPTSPLVFYVKHKNFVVRYDFARDPEEFIQSPTYEKFMLIEGGDAHQNTPAPAPAPAN